MQDISRRVKKVIADLFAIDISKVADDATLMEDLGADSLDALELSIAMEEEFGIDPETDDCGLKPETVTVAQIIEHVRGELGAGR